MCDSLYTLLVVPYAAILLFGGTVTYFSYRAYRRTGTRALGGLCLGLGLITLGLLSHGGICPFLPGSIGAALLSSSLAAVGFGFLLYSLYTYRDRQTIEEAG